MVCNHATHFPGNVVVTGANVLVLVVVLEVVTGGLVGIIIGSTGAIGGIGISHRCIPQHFISIVAELGFGNASVTTLPPLPVHVVSSAQKHL